MLLILSVFRKSPPSDVSKSNAAPSIVTTGKFLTYSQLHKSLCLYLDTDQQPLLPPRQKSSQSQKDLEIIQKSTSKTLSDRANTSGVSANVTMVLLSLETTVDQLSRRIHHVENRLSLMAADIKKLKVANNMDLDDVHSSQLVQHMTRSDVS